MRRLIALARRIRFSLRTATLLVALAAVALTVITVWIPYIRWRIQVRTLIRQRLAMADPPPKTGMPPNRKRSWAPFKVYFNFADGDYEALVRNPDFTTESFLDVIRKEPSVRNRIMALQSLSHYLGDVQSSSATALIVPDMIDLATDVSEPGEIRSNAYYALTNTIGGVGLSQEHRSLVIAAAEIELRRSPFNAYSPVDHWMSLLATIGGREERALLIALTDHPRLETRRGARRAIARGSRMAEDVERIAAWVDEDKSLISDLLNSPAIQQTATGHELLLRLAADTTKPEYTRQWAASRLQQSADGERFLIAALEDPTLRVKLAPLLYPHLNPLGPKDPDPRVVARLHRAQIEEIESRYWRDPWSHLVAILHEPSQMQYGFTIYRRESSRSVLPPPKERASLIAERVALARDLLRRLTGRSDLTTYDEWAAWLTSTKPGPIPKRTWLEAVADRPALLASVVEPDRIEAMSRLTTDEIPLYERLARSDQPVAIYEGARALLLYADRLDMVPVLIDLIEQQASLPPAKRMREPIWLLRGRFGENFFWDAPAWRSWWKGRSGAISGKSANGGA